jgi:membrane protease YdiL (CAAX protease family)
MAVIIASLPGILLLFWFRSMDRADFSVSDMLVYPLVFGTGLTILILLLNRFMCRASLGSFSPGKDTVAKDLGWSLVLLFVYIALAVIQQLTLVRWLPSEGPPPEIQNLIIELSHNPLLLAIWLGPVVWIGVALFEELHKAFFLKCLWEVWDTPRGKWLVVLAATALTGAVHSYQGIAGVISTGIMGFIAAVFYMKRRRILPLIVAHALYDSAWIILGVVMSSNS